MYIEISPVYFHARTRRFAVSLLVLLLGAGNAQLSLADFTWAGPSAAQIVGFDTSLAGNNRGGGTTGDMIVAVDDLGGILGDGEQIIGGVNPLESSSAIIGQGLDAIGAVTLNDSISRWEISTDLTIGQEGQGLLEIGTSATVDVTGKTTLGEEPLSSGILNVNGTLFPGARLKTDELLVGNRGVGRVELTDRGSLVSVVSNIGFSTDPGSESGIGTVMLTDSGTRWTSSGDVIIGGLVAGDSQGNVMVANQAVFQVAENSSSISIPTLTLNPRGTIELAGGTVRVLPQNGTNPILNSGVISGDGFVDGDITIFPSGQLRNAASEANQREQLIVSETVTVMSGVTRGLIESFGGEMEFQNEVINTGDIIARDAILRFRGIDLSGAANDLDLQAGGLLLVLGDSTIHGMINNSGGTVRAGDGSIIMTPTIFGDIIFTFAPLVASFSDGGLAASGAADDGVLDVTVGDILGLNIVGELDLGGVATLEVDIASGIDVMLGNTYQVLTASDGIVGSFANNDNEVVADGFVWDIDIMGDDVFITAASVFSGFDGDFDGDGDVDGSDFLTWQRGPASASDLSDWQTNYGSGSSSIAATSAVPEPSTLALALLTLTCLPRRRQQR